MISLFDTETQQPQSLPEASEAQVSLEMPSSKTLVTEKPTEINVDVGDPNEIELDSL